MRARDYRTFDIKGGDTPVAAPEWARRLLSRPAASGEAWVNGRPVDVLIRGRVTKAQVETRLDRYARVCEGAQAAVMVLMMRDFGVPVSSFELRQPRAWVPRRVVRWLKGVPNGTD